MSAPVLYAPDPVSTYITHLYGAFPSIWGDTVEVFRAVPQDAPSQFVRVRLVGGTGRSDTVITTYSLAIECYANDVATAYDLALVAETLVHASRGSVLSGVKVYRIQSVGSPVELPDPLSHQPRVSFTVAVSFRLYS
jgi:hypothetical protein